MQKEKFLREEEELRGSKPDVNGWSGLVRGEFTPTGSSIADRRVSWTPAILNPKDLLRTVHTMPALSSSSLHLDLFIISAICLITHLF